MFDYKLLEALGAAVDEGGFEKASRTLHITQSAVSQRIKQLEESEGQVLITRTTPPAPTQRGEELLAHYRKVKHLEDGLQQQGKIEQRSPPTFSIGINADSLATWFLPCISPFLKEHDILLDIHVEDQEQTLDLLKKGRVLGCVSTREVSAHGCSIIRLGTMRYTLCCTPDYMTKWFPEGLSIDSARRAPIMRFNRNDHLNDLFFNGVLGYHSPSRCEYHVPSSESFFQFVYSGIACGILPELQSRPHLASNALVDCMPGAFIDVNLFWHSWSLKTALMEDFTHCLMKNSALCL